MAKALTKIGYRLQYSVFAADLTDEAKRDLIEKLKGLLNESDDDLRFYLVPLAPRGAWHGPLPGEGSILVTGAPAATLAERLRDGDRRRWKDPRHTNK